MPAAAAALARLNVSVLSRASTAAGGLLAGGDDGLGGVVLDVSAVLGATAFSAAPRRCDLLRSPLISRHLPSSPLLSAVPRSGLSVHLDAQRACARDGAQCAPHGCVAYTSTGCGGRFPASLLSRAAAAAEPTLAGRSGPHSRRCREIARAACTSTSAASGRGARCHSFWMQSRSTERHRP